MPHKTRWLSTKEVRSWRAATRVTRYLFQAMESQLQREAGLSFVEYHTLAMLSEQPDHTMRMSRLADLTNASLSRLSHLVTRLERRRFVRRASDPANGRFTNAILTDEGYEKLVAAAPAHVTQVRELILDEFTAEEIQQIGEFAERLLNRIGAPLSTTE
jgi:DNA-binding MarR family transcriptional regulator